MTKKRIGKRRRLNRRGRALVLLLVFGLAVLLGHLGQRYLPYVLYPTPYHSEVLVEARAAQVDPMLVLAVAKVESGFNAEAVSQAGAVGVMQIMPETAKWLTGKLGEEFREDGLTEPAYNIHLGVEYLRFLLDYWDGDLPKVIASYNAGQTKVAEWIAGGVWDGTEEGAEQIPYEETRQYVMKVSDVYREYCKLY